MPPNSFRRLKASLCSIYNLPSDGDIFLHFLLPLQKSARCAEAKLYVTMPCKVYFASTDSKQFRNTGYVGKILLSLPYFVIYSMPAAGHVFLTKWLINKLDGSALPKADRDNLTRLSEYRVFEYAGRGCDLTNHQPVLVSRFLARTEADVSFFKQINQWHFLVDSCLLRTSFEDFEILENLNISRTFSLDALGKCLETIVDRSGAPVFDVSFRKHHMPHLYYNKRDSDISVLSSSEYFKTNASLLSVSVELTGHFNDSMFVNAIRRLWHGLFDAPPPSAPPLDRFLFVSSTFDIEVGCIPPEQRKF